AFDQLGCPLVIFPVAGQTPLSAALSKAEVVDFISYCLSQHNKTQKSSLVSVVADLREASAASTRFIAETLLLLEVEQKRTVHTAYIVQPKRKDVLRMLGKLWSPSKSQPATFNKVLLKEVFELSNYIDRSQLMASLGGYLVYCHQSWAVFTKEMDAFEEHFGSVVKRLPGCLSSVQALSTRPLPNSVPELQLFCSSIETHFQQLQRELGLDDLLKHCKLLVEKLRSPDLDPHFQAMAGTALFTLHFSSMLQYHRRITATVQKVELLWQEVFSKARLQLHVLQMREAALQITEQIESLLQHKLQPYNIHMARDGTEADQLTSEFHSSVYTPAMSLVVAAEEVVCTLTEQMSNALGRERWLLDLHRLKDKLHSTVHLTLQTLQAYIHFQNASLFQLFSGIYSHNNCIFRCMILRRMIMSSEPVPIAQIQVALQWQYELLQSSLVKQREHSSPIDTEPDLHFQEANPRTATHRDSRVNLLGLVTTTEGKQSSHSSFDSGFEGAGSSRLEGHTVAPDFVKQTVNQPQIQEDTASTLSDSGGFGSLGNSSRASVNIAPKATLNSLDFEIKVKRSAAHPTNPWLSLPDDDLENSYTVTITPKPSLEQKDSCFSFNSQKNKELCPGSPAAHPTAWALHTQSSLEDSELSPMTHVLSSTVTEPTDQATGEPSMLWDSYDLHEQYLDSTEGVSAPLKDWDIKEEENLTEVERTLERTDKILTEEECVLAQEVQLDVLLRSEVEPYPWLAWNNQVELTFLQNEHFSSACQLVLFSLQMSLNELSKGNVVDLDQFGAKSQFETDLNLQPADWRAKPDLLTELKEVHALDQKILEENFKINQLRQEDCLEEVVQRNSDRLNVQNVRMQLTEEKLEQKTSENKSVRNCQVKKPKERATRVIRCSIMSRTDSEEDRALCNEALSVQSCSEVSHSKDELRQSCSSDPTQSKKTCMKLQDNTTHSPSEPPVSNKMVSSRNPAQSPSDVGVTPDCTVDREVEPGIERGACSQPIPKPRKKTLSLKKQTNQHSTHRSKYGSTLPVDTMDAYASSVNTEEASTPTVDKLNLVGRTSGLTSGDLPAEGTESGGVLAENTEGEGVPTEGRGSTRTDTEDRSIPAEGGEVPTEGGSSTTAKDTEGRRSIPAEGGGMPTEDTEGKEGMPTEDTEGRGRTPAEDSESGDVPAENTEGVGVPTESRGSTPTNDTEGRSILTESGGVPTEDTEGRGRTPTEDNEGRRISTEGGGNLGTSIILDTGSGLMKAGFADEDLPSVLFPTIIGVPKYEEIMNSSSVKDTYVGHEAQHMRGVLALRHPIKNGIIGNWDDMQRIWQHTFDLLRVDPGEHPVLLTEAPMNPLENKQRAMEIMFEFFGVPYSYVAMQAMLALYAAGRTTGVVLDSGDGVTHSVPVYEGYVLPHAVQRFPLAGADVTAHLTKVNGLPFLSFVLSCTQQLNVLVDHQLLQEQGVCMRTTAEQEIVREMKEKCCCVSLNYEVELHDSGSYGEASYTMPDGKIVTLGSERIRAPEILFKPDLIGRDHYGLHESVYKSILNCDLDLRRDFLGNVVLS
ncbi:hypothetical protein NL108_014818, partial [Boleophthalmus pectinirostris]